ncbi:hypothetical protein N0V83_001195 [Neocucurbitaria cava]|uniref:VOC domain-containing protein n=1 Tax=Neocucurbitaria cava TaxID=798079 RepID=A0A9W8YF47_9PLEO|nr:hypothetical protein N0V83_001195 [Neocucurbitaria cava]
MSTNPKPAAPPMPPTGAPYWINIMAIDPQKLKVCMGPYFEYHQLLTLRKEFYSTLFPAWQFQPAEAGMEGMVQFAFEQPSGLSGGIVKLPDGCVKPSEQPMGIGTIVYYSVESTDEITENIVKLGGVKVMDKMGHKDRGWFANFKDPEGNRFGTYEPNKVAMDKQE